jgi:TetR/AcrR family transcriptional repressor of nem operon
MGRTRSFNDYRVLAATARLFRKVGFTATSLKDLERTTGLQAGSLYHAFGNKKAIFLRALDAYCDSVVRRRITTYLKGVRPLQELEEFFTSTYETEKNPSAGCLLTNSATEIGANDREINTKIEEGFSLLRAAFASHIRLAHQRGLTQTHLSADAAAEFLLTAYQGLLVRLRNGTPPRILSEIIHLTIRSLSMQQPTN